MNIPYCANDYRLTGNYLAENEENEGKGNCLVENELIVSNGKIFVEND